MSDESPTFELLPPARSWEYTVAAVSELGGTATAKGVASMMEQVLNDYAKGGWELVVTTERASRWIGGETVLLTFRRECTTAEQFQNRCFAEARLRREVESVLDQIEAAESPE